MTTVTRPAGIREVVDLGVHARGDFWSQFLPGRDPVKGHTVALGRTCTGQLALIDPVAEKVAWTAPQGMRRFTQAPVGALWFDGLQQGENSLVRRTRLCRWDAEQ
jgi:hypothetical protein